LISPVKQQKKFQIKRWSLIVSPQLLDDFKRERQSMQQSMWLPVASIERRHIFGSWPRHRVAVVVVWRKVRARALSVQTLLQTLRTLHRTKNSLASSCQPPNNAGARQAVFYSTDGIRPAKIKNKIDKHQKVKIEDNRWQ
jgi:hypothetical protein